MFFTTMQVAAATLHLVELEEQKRREKEDRRRREARRRTRRQRTQWVRQWLLRRPMYGQYEKLMHELTTEDPTSFKNFLRVDPDIFMELLHRVGPRIEKQDTFFRKALPPGLKLAVTLRYLATGDSYKSVAYSFRVAFNAVCIFIPEVCQAVIDEYSSEVLVCPTTPDGWKEVALGFQNRWNFPHVIGAIDGKHVAIRKPMNSGSFYYNYKGFFSIVVLAVVDADYKFLYCDIGANGAGSDAGIFNDTELKDYLETNQVGLPLPEPLPGDDKPMPYFLVGDDAFASKTWLMKPLPLRNMSDSQRVFNYRLSRARRVVENAFGITANRFRCLLTTMPQQPDRVTTIALSCCVLHNLLRLRKLNTDLPVDNENPDTHELVPGIWRDNSELPDMAGNYRGYTNVQANSQRQYLVEYFNSEAGSVPWQLDVI